MYEKSFNIEAQNISGGRTYLDLGKVGDIATIKLNGNEIGILWKPPYILDISDYINEGENKLEVAVTNLWINRLIGDEKLPPEERKTSTNLSNVEGRYSFDRFSEPDGDKYLRYSGLMGPVRVHFTKLFKME